MSVVARTEEYDLKNAVCSNRLEGLWRLMAGYRLTYLGASISLAGAALARATTFLLLRQFVDDILAREGAAGQVAHISLGFVGLALVEGTFSFLSGSLAARAAEAVAQRLRDYLFDHIQRLSFAYHDRTSTGELIQRCTSDVDAVRRFFSEQAIGAARIVALFVVNLAALLRLNARLAVLSVSVVPILVVMSVGFFRRVSKAYEALQDQEAALSTVLQENLSGVRVVKAFARQRFECDKFGRHNWERFLRGKRFLELHALYWPISDTLCGAQMLLSVGLGALMARNGSISVGTYVAYTGLIIWVIWPMRNLGRLIVDMSSGLVSYQRVAEVIAEEREPLDEGDWQPSEGVRGQVVFDAVGFRYPSGYEALSRISFSCQPGQVVGLLGSTGSGKTTLVNLLPRFYDPAEGSLTLDGVELGRYPRGYLRQQIGIVEQEPFLFSRSIRENLTYGVHRDVTQPEVEQAARTAAVHEDIMGFPAGYDTIVGERGVMLSGGQKQRIAIARALLKDPRILILDDCTSSVDVGTEHLIRQALKRLMEGRTTFVIAHRVQSVTSADLILVFDEGRIVEQGTHRELLRHDGIYRQIYEMQTRVEEALEREVDSVGVS